MHEDGSVHEIDASAYLKRIGCDVPEILDAAALATLQVNHLRNVPFENLSLHMDEPIVLNEAALLDKIVTRKRGGFCYELNAAFAWLLQELGYPVVMLAARVYHGFSPGPPLDHMALRVELDEPWLVDVGFGHFAQEPLRLATRQKQIDPAGTFRVTKAQHGDLIIRMNDRPQYLIESHPRELGDFQAMCWYQQHSPTSQFVKSPVSSRLTTSGQVSMSGRTLKQTVNGETTRVEFDTHVDILAAYREHLGMDLDRLPNDPRES